MSEKNGEKFLGNIFKLAMQERKFLSVFFTELKDVHSFKTLGATFQIAAASFINV